VITVDGTDPGVANSYSRNHSFSKVLNKDLLTHGTFPKNGGTASGARGGIDQSDIPICKATGT
jgi:hypothetical protein